MLGTWSLVGSLLAGLFVYGTTEPFIGSRPDELSVEYDESPISTDTYVELLNRYENGVLRNELLLQANGFVLGVSRLLLAVAVVPLVWSLASRLTVPPVHLSTPV